MDKKLVWTEEQTAELEKLASQFNSIDKQIKDLTAEKTNVRSKITDLLSKFKQTKILTENFQVNYITVNGSKSLDASKLKAKLVSLNIKIDDSFYKFSSSHERLDIKPIEIPSEDDPHRIKVTLEDLNI